MFHYDEIGFVEAKKNINKQATKILYAIADAYQDGTLDSPNSMEVFCNLLACICEGKVEGSIEESTMEVHWSLTKKYQEYLENIPVTPPGNDNCVAGPWPQ
ncbi:MAG: hypothetical protein CMA72_09120 [Euryarchaeota archaeon]|jgi:hypothetical protein|nr:hypothetical protein [Euryarchaeota archaeon]|tara:strand:+ start:2057 stop:2359 length:303 start_codon:yes stop_codon:yes gene_type:complete